jgi:hypothetical protein
MFERLKRALVESLVGAVALGYLFAECVLHFVKIFTSPLGVWFMRNEYREFVPHTTGLASGLLRAALSELVAFLLLLLAWFVLVRWLYFTPLKPQASEPMPNPEQAA